MASYFHELTYHLWNMRILRLFLKLRFLLCLLLVAYAAESDSSELIAIRLGKLWDGQTVKRNVLIVIQNGRIQSVTEGNPSPPPGAKVIDWSNLYGLPGLIDAHTHMTYYWDRQPGTRPLGQSRLPAVTVFLAQENARKTLETGVTTVRDLGSSEYMDIAMRQLIDRGAMPGPRMFVSGYGISVPRETRPGRPESRSPGEAASPEQVMEAVRRQVAAGADVIKMYGSEGGFDNVGTQQTFTYEEMKAAVTVAHAMGKKIAIHSYGPEGARNAVRAGADTLEHAVDIDDETLALMVKQGTFYVPTIDHNRYYIDAAGEYQFAPGYLPRLQDYIQKNLKTAQRAYRAGVKFGMGSDAVFTMFGQNTRELAWLVKTGMSPEEALKAATVNGAALLGKSQDLGSVTPGHYADIVAVEGDPLARIDIVIQQVKAVMKGGAVVVAPK